MSKKVHTVFIFKKNPDIADNFKVSKLKRTVGCSENGQEVNGTFIDEPTGIVYSGFERLDSPERGNYQHNDSRKPLKAAGISNPWGDDVARATATAKVWSKDRQKHHRMHKNPPVWAIKGRVHAYKIAQRNPAFYSQGASNRFRIKANRRFKTFVQLA